MFLILCRFIDMVEGSRLWRWGRRLSILIGEIEITFRLSLFMCLFISSSIYLLLRFFSVLQSRFSALPPTFSLLICCTLSFRPETRLCDLELQICTMHGFILGCHETEAKCIVCSSIDGNVGAVY
jgi:hypothetical protein